MAPASSGTQATAVAPTSPVVMLSQRASLITGTAAAGSSRYGATNGPRPRSEPCTAVLAGLSTAVTTAKAASVTVAWLPSTEVTTSEPS